MMTFKKVIHGICAVCLFVSLPTAAGVVGTLSWDTVSDVIVDSQSQTEYVQLGLQKAYNYNQTVALTAPGQPWEGFQLATQSDAYAFVNSLISDTGTQLIDDQVSTVAQEWQVKTNTSFVDGVLGNNFDGRKDYFFFQSDFSNRFGLVELDSQNQTVMMREVNSLVHFSNNFAQSGTSREESWVSYLLVKHDPSDTVSAVPEESTLLLLSLGMLGLFGLRGRNKNG